MPTMTTPQEIAAAIDSALEAGGHLVIRFGHGQMRQLKLEEVELLVATLKGSAVPEERTTDHAILVLEDILRRSVMSKFARSTDCQIYRHAIEDCIKALNERRPQLERSEDK